MRVHRQRKGDSSYDINLAPFLDIIIVIIPMLLLSIAFIQVRMIETNVPQVVAQKINEQKKQDEPTVSFALKADLATGFVLEVKDKGRTNDVKIALKDGKFDFEKLTQEALNLKRQHIDIFTMDFMPASTVPYDSIVKTMDALRRLPASEGKISVKDSKTGEVTQTDMMFPDVTFANVVE